jgi:site-specific DNA-methyltransferase (adenine-specific)
MKKIIEMKRYSEHENSFLYHMNCMDALPLFPDRYFDPAIIDAPYGTEEDGSKNHLRISRKYPHPGGRKYRAFNDVSAPGNEYWRELFRVSENRIIRGANHFISRLSAQDTSCRIIRDRDNRLSHSADGELAWTSFNSAGCASSSSAGTECGRRR